MANEKKSIIEEALLEAQQIDATFKSNAKEILAKTMSSEIEEMVKESLTGSKNRLKEDEEEEQTDLTLDVDSDDESDDELDLELGIEDEGSEEEGSEGEESEEESEETEEGEEIGDEISLEDLNLGDNDIESELDVDLGGEEGVEDVEDIETVDLTSEPLSDVISVFKKMGPEDEIEVVNDNGIVTLKDNKSGSEYRIEMNPTGEVAGVEAGEIDLGESVEDSEEIIYEIEIEDEEEVEDDMSYMDYMEDDHWGSKKDEFKRRDGHKLGDVDGHYKDYEGKEDYMSRVKSSKGRYMTGNRTNPEAMNRMGGSESYKATYGESKAPQITKLISENTELKNKNMSLVSENKELKENQDKMVESLKEFRKKLQEVAVFNSNLTYAVRLFTENTTTKEEKQEILQRLDSAKTLKESQSIYKQLVKEVSNSKAPIKESVEEKITKTSSSGSAQISEQSVFVHPELQNMKKLWEYSYKK